MPASTDPEKFSIDEMMERLKNRPREDPIEDGELVTREDGTQAIRVRKRKRRSHQPQKEKQRRTRRARMIQASGAVILLLMAGFAIGSAIVYANSAPFREAVVRMIQTSTGAEVELEQFRVSPTQANAGRLTLNWPERSVIKQLSVRGISANIAPASFLGKSLSGDEINSNEAMLVLGLAGGESSPESGAGDHKEVPSIRFKRYAVPRLSIGIGNPERPALLLRDTEASFQPDNANERPQLLLTRGLIAAPGWPGIKLDRAHIEFRDREIDIVGMRLVHQDDYRGVMDLAGSIEPYARDRQAGLDVRMEYFQLSAIAPEMSGMIEGRIETVSTPQSNQLTFFPGPQPDAKLKLSFRKTLHTPIEMRGLKFLGELGALLGDNWFEKPVFEMDASGDILRTSAGVAFENLNFEHRGRMALRGGIGAGSDGRLSGKLEVGIAEAMMVSAGNRRLESLFGSAEDGFRWITLNISGNAKSPLDNFMELYEAATTTSAVPGTESIPSFEELIAPE